MRFIVNIFRLLFNKDGRKFFIKYARASAATYIKKDYKQAITDYKFILDNGGLKFAEHLIYECLGIAYYHNEEYGQALVALEKALELSLKIRERSSTLYQYLGYTYTRLRKFEEALMFYERAAQFGKRGFLNKGLTNVEHVNEMRELLEKHKDLLPFMTAYFEQNKDRLRQGNK